MQHQQQEIEASSHNHVSPSPSFSSYSSETLAEIAARVIQELRLDPHSVTDDDDDDALFPPWENDNHGNSNNFAPQNDNDDDDALFPLWENDNHGNSNNFAPQNDDDDDQTENDDDFEFAFVSRDFTSPVSADDIFYNGQIRPMYPIFDALNRSNDAVSTVPNRNQDEMTGRRRLPLRRLMFEEGETASCSSSTDESVDLEGLAEGTYCVWNPNSVVRERKKSNSTGSGSKRWKLRDLLLRSHSDGKNKQQVMFQIPTNKVAAKPQHETKNRTVGTVAKEHGDHSKRKSYLPYRPELVGLFTNVNGLGRNLRPF